MYTTMCFSPPPSPDLIFNKWSRGSSNINKRRSHLGDIHRTQSYSLASAQQIARMHSRMAPSMQVFQPHSGTVQISDENRPSHSSTTVIPGPSSSTPPQSDGDMGLAWISVWKDVDPRVWELGSLPPGSHWSVQLLYLFLLVVFIWGYVVYFFPGCGRLYTRCCRQRTRFHYTTVGNLLDRYRFARLCSPKTNREVVA